MSETSTDQGAALGEQTRGRAGKSDQAFRTISEVAKDLDLPQHVLRFWETKFHQISPMKRGGGRRYYRPEDVDLLRRIKALLHFDGYTIKGVQKLLSIGGVNNLPQSSSEESPQAIEKTSETLGQLDMLSNHELTGLVGELEDIRDQLKKYIS
ncbi:MAG: MerR family transcriptional regulator [Magnetovibrio sp.]|nr:MerR family transcriptional regulator [Magnetovibrio sp.]